MQQTKQLNPINCVLFDLDGTLVDTAPDMANALNVLLEKHQHSTLPLENIRGSVSKGSVALIKLGFKDTLDEQQLPELQQQYLNIYSEALCVESALFTGLPELLDALDNQAISWGVVTNKPGWLAEPLLAQLNLLNRCHCLVSGDTLSRRKPHPDPLLLASKQLKQPVSECVYIGDDQRDIEAGNAAGMRTLIAGYGYIDSHETPDNWGADDMIKQADELPGWLNGYLKKKIQ